VKPSTTTKESTWCIVRSKFLATEVIIYLTSRYSL